MVEKLFIGVVLALIYSEITGIVPGGLIVPAFVALTLDNFWRALLTLGAALITLAIFRLASKFFLLFGRRRFFFLLLLGACLSELSYYLNQKYWVEESLNLSHPEIRIVGLIIPGLLASNLERQKFWLTLASFITVTIMAYFIGKLIG